MLQVDADHFDTDFVQVKNGLHFFAHAGGNLVAFLSQGRVHPHFAHHLTDRGFSRLDHRFGGVAAFEEVSTCIVQSVLNGKLDLNNVFVFGEHGRLTQARGLDDVVTANVNRPDLGHKNQLVTLNRVRHAPIETSADSRVVFAKLCDHSLLTFLHNEKARGQPNQQGPTQNHPDAQVFDEGWNFGSTRSTTRPPGALRTLRSTFATENLSQFSVEITPQLIQIRRAALLLWRASWRLLPCIRLGARWGNIVARLGARLVGRLVIVTTPARVVQIEHASDLCRQQGPSKGWEVEIHGFYLCQCDETALCRK